jgi:hypothetical protein
MDKATDNGIALKRGVRCGRRSQPSILSVQSMWRKSMAFRACVTLSVRRYPDRRFVQMTEAVRQITRRQARPRARNGGERLFVRPLRKMLQAISPAVSLKELRAGIHHTSETALTKNE